MTDHNEALDRLRATNPVPTTEVIDPDEISTVAALCEERRLTPDREPIPEPLKPRRRNVMRPALAFASAFGAVIIAAAILTLFGSGGESVVGESPPATTLPPAPTTTVPEPMASVSDDPWGSPAIWISDTAIGADGSIWAATNGGMVRWLPDVDQPTVYTTDDGLPFDVVWNIAIGPDGAVWTGGDGWIARFDGAEQSEWIVFPAEDSFGPMAIGPDGSVWSVAGLDRLMRFDGSAWESFTIPEVAGNDSPWSFSVSVAPDGTVWAGANDYRGLVSYDGSDFTYRMMWDGVPDQSAATVAIASDGTVWVSGDIAGDDPGTGVSSFDGESWTHYTTEDGLLSNAARIATGPAGTVWAVHYGPENSSASGASRFDGSSWTAFPDIPALGFPGAVDSAGTLWAPASDHASVISFNGVESVAFDLPTLEPAPAGPGPGSSTPGEGTPGAAQVVGDWSPILTEQRADLAPTTATCPNGTSPDTPGPTNQKRPQPDEYSNMAADFDRVWGRVVYMDSLRNTWTLDVCTNTWHEMNADGVLPGGGSLVYDVDSDRTVLFGDSLLWIYDRDLNSWEWRSAPQSASYGWSSLSAFYDPQSGLIVTNRSEESVRQTTHTFNSYDVDTDEWTAIGSIAFASDGYYPVIIGYSHEADRIVTAGVFSEFGLHLIDPRSGVVEVVEQPHPEFVGGFGYSELASGAPTAYAVSLGPQGSQNMVCGLDATTFEWGCVPSVPPRGQAYSPFDAITYDWINDRLVFIGGARGGWNDGPMTYFDDVWSLDPETGEWLELIPPSSGDS